MDNSAAPGEIYLKDYLVSHLTSERFIKDDAELKMFCAGAGFYPESDRYTVVVVQIERWSQIFSSEAQWMEAIKHHFLILTNMLSELLNRDNIAVVAERDYRMVCVVNLLEDWEDFCRNFRQNAEQMLEILETEFNISATVAVGEMTQALRGVPAEYQKGLEALWYNDFLGRDQQILIYDQLWDQSYPMIRSELTELDRKLITRLQTGDIPGVKYVLHEMIDREFIQSVPTVKFLRVRLGGICCKILDALEELKSGIGDELYYSLDPGSRICEAASLESLVAAMDDIFDAVCLRRSQEAQEPKPQWVDKMSQFISEHYTNENLSLTEVSGAFGITPSYATRVFKQYTGRGIYETIQHERLTAAKGLLYSNLTMKEIAEAVGYTSFLSMNRAFKKYEGSTPSQFKG